MYLITRNFKGIFAIIGLVLIVYFLKNPNAYDQIITNFVMWYFQTVGNIVERILTPVFNTFLQSN